MEAPINPQANHPNTPTLLVTGTSGQVGGELLQTLAPLGAILAPPRAALDLTAPTSIRACLRHTRPQWIVNAAAYTAVDRAESEPTLAAAINTEAPRILGEEALTLGATVIHFSTDYVFDGRSSRPYREDDPTNPLSAYGATKRAGEQALLATGANAIILRTSWVYGATGKNFLRTILKLARERPELRIVDDQQGAPTWSRDLANLAAHILAHPTPQPGIYHATASGHTTWAAFAQQALAQLPDQANLATITPIPTSEYPTPAARPANSRLDNTKLNQTFQHTMPDWRDSLTQVLTLLNPS